MNFLSKFSIGKRLILGIILILALFVSAVILGFTGLSESSDAEAVLMSEYQDILALSNLKQIATGLTLLYMDIIIDRADSIVAAERTALLEKMERQLDDARNRLAVAARTQMQSESGTKMVENLREMIKIGKTELVPAVNRGETDEGFWVRIDDVIDKLTTETNGHVDQLTEWLRYEMEEARRHSSETKQRVRMNLILLMVVGLIAALLLTYGIRRSIIKPVFDMVERAEELAEGDVDMRKRIQVASKDEIGTLVGLFNKFLDRLAELVAKINEVSGLLQISTERVTNGGVELSHRTNEQAVSITETSATLEQFTSILKHNTEGSESARAMLNEFYNEIQGKRELIVNVTETMAKISESSSQIDSIVNVINDISFQTNLLALNAAVEAARAGEAGRGFAVVAAEVRNLAQKTAESSKTIQEIVNQSVESTQKGMRLIKETSVFFETVVTTFQQMSEKIHQIAISSQEQATGVDQISQAVMQLEGVINQNAALVDEFTAAGKDIKKNTKQLAHLMARFKTGDETETATATPKTTDTRKAGSTQKDHADKNGPGKDKKAPPATPAPKNIKDTKDTKDKKDKKEPPKASPKEKEEPVDDFFGSDEGDFEEF